MNPELFTHLSARLSNMPMNTDFTLKEWFGPGWTDFGSNGDRRTVGTPVRIAVEAGRFGQVRFNGIGKGRSNVFQRTA